MTAPDAPFDSGLQAERTLLAWRRTALALAVVSAAGTRFTAPILGWASVAVGAVGVALAAVAYFATGIRYRQVHHALRQSARHPGNGWPATALSAAAALIGTAALTYILVDPQ